MLLQLGTGSWLLVGFVIGQEQPLLFLALLGWGMVQGSHLAQGSLLVNGLGISHGSSVKFSGFSPGFSVKFSGI